MISGIKGALGGDGGEGGNLKCGRASGSDSGVVGDIWTLISSPHKIGCSDGDGTWRSSVSDTALGGPSMPSIGEMSESLRRHSPVWSILRRRSRATRSMLVKADTRTCTVHGSGTLTDATPKSFEVTLSRAASKAVVVHFADNAGV